MIHFLSFEVSASTNNYHTEQSECVYLKKNSCASHYCCKYLEKLTPLKNRIKIYVLVKIKDTEKFSSQKCSIFAYLAAFFLMSYVHNSLSFLKLSFQMRFQGKNTDKLLFFNDVNCHQ